MAELTIRTGHPEFLDLPWDEPIATWEAPNIVKLPKGISRHEVRFLQYPAGLYAIKELPTAPARREYSVLRHLESIGAPAVRPVGLVELRHPEDSAERSAAVITEYESFSFSYRELLEGPGFGARRNQMLNAFAELLAALHMAGVFWGDCSLSNVLYRFDAEAIETIMVDAETSVVVQGGTLSDGQRTEDLEVMIINVAGGMADIAAAAGHDLDSADLTLGEDIAERYRGLWAELTAEETIGADEGYRIRQRIERLNAIGFDVEEVDLVPADPTGSRMRLKVKVGGRNYHTNHLHRLTGIEALEHQARQILSDLHHYQAMSAPSSPTGKNVAAVRWRVERFEPMIEQLGSLPQVSDPIQAFCDVLHHRYVMSAGAGSDVGTDTAYRDWLERGRPGYPIA